MVKPRKLQLWSIRTRFKMESSTVKTNFLSIVLFAASMLTASSAFAHGGGLDSSGCHHAKRGYHCHPERMYATQKARGANVRGLNKTERHYKRECQGAVNAGACAGYTR